MREGELPRGRREAADREAEHREGRGQCGRPINPELGLHRGQHDDDRPHADVPDRAERRRSGEPTPGAARVGDPSSAIPAQI